MRIAYLSSAAIPSPSANSLQVMKMCQAFVQEGHAVLLVLPPAEGGAPEEVPAPALLASRYGLRVDFPIRRVKLLPLLGRRGLAWAEADEAARIVPNLVYTRGIDIAWAVAQHGFPVLLEVHQPPAGRLGPLYFRQILGGGLTRNCGAAKSWSRRTPSTATPTSGFRSRPPRGGACACRRGSSPPGISALWPPAAAWS
jgi:hypothetical protein